MGKVMVEAAGDVQEAIDMTLYMAGEGRRMFGQTTPSELPNKFQMSVRMPIGVVGVITPWNFPIAIPSWKIAPALVCGNTVVFKPAEDTPLLAERFVELLEESGLPAGVVNVVHGYGEEVGEAIVKHPDVPVITFTGSRETGVRVTHTAADQLKLVHLELGGKNAIVVMDDANLDLAVDGIVWSAFGTSGQRCTAASRIVVHEQVYDELQSRLVAAAEQMRLGPGWEPETDLGPVINRASIEKIHAYTEIGKDEGATLLTGGEVATGNGLDKGFYYRPTIFGDVDPGMRIAQEEIFGPTTALIKVKDFDEAVRAVNGVKYGLSSAIFTQDVNRAFRAMRDLQHGHHVHQRRHDRRRGSSAVRRNEGHRQRPPRGRPGRARRLHRVEGDLRRLLGQAAARADRQRVTRSGAVAVAIRELEEADLPFLREMLYAGAHVAARRGALPARVRARAPGGRAVPRGLGPRG